MRISCLALLVAAAVLTHVTDAQLAAADSQLTISESANSLTASENVATFKRFLRADKTAAEDDEERGINIEAIPGLEKLKNLFKTKITPETLKGWANKEESSDNVFLKLKLDETGNKLFDNPYINVWAEYANAVSKSNPETAMLATLTSRYSDDVLSEMIIAAMKVQNTKKVATDLQTEQVQSWLTAAKSPDDVFNWFLLNKAGDDLLTSPQLATWMNYLELFNKNNPEKQTTLISAMTKSYGDEGVVTILEAAKLVPSTAKTAKGLETELLQLWLKNKKSPDDVNFSSWFLLDKAGDDLLTSPQLATWMNYLKLFNKNNPKKQTTLISPMTKSYGDEGVVTILEAAKLVPSTAKTAKGLETELLQLWLKNKKSPDDVNFSSWFLLDKAGDDLLTSPQLATWMNYLELFNKNNPKKQTTLISAMTKSYGDEGVVTILEAAKLVPSTAKTAKGLETELLQLWLKNKKSPDDVLFFNWFLLNKAGDDLLTSPQLATWMNYLKLFNKNNPKKQTTLISAMTKSYGNEGVVKILEAAKLVPSTAKTAKRLETELLQLWLKNKKSPDDVFKALMLNKAGDDLFTSPQLNTFTKYMNTFNKENDKQTTLIAAMTTGYGDNKLWTMLQTAKTVPNTKRMATDLEAAQYQYWLSSDRGPDKVFKALSLDKAGDNLLSSPQFATFIKYTNEFHVKNFDKGLTTMSAVRAYYTDFDVAKMIMAGEKVPRTQKAAARMEGELFKSWTAPETPDDAFRALKLTSSGNALFENPMLSFWTKFLDDYNKVRPGKTTSRWILTSTYDDKTLVKMIDDAKMNPSTKTVAEKVEKEMLWEFILDEKQPIYVATLLNANTKADPNWKLWKKYMQDYHKYHIRGITTA